MSFPHLLTKECKSQISCSELLKIFREFSKSSIENGWEEAERRVAREWIFLQLKVKDNRHYFSSLITTSDSLESFNYSRYNYWHTEPHFRHCVQMLCQTSISGVMIPKGQQSEQKLFYDITLIADGFLVRFLPPILEHFPLVFG